MMDFIKSTWLLVAFACLMLLILSGCIRFTITNDKGITDAEITVQPTEESIQNSIENGELEPGVNIGISVPISLTEEN